MGSAKLTEAEVREIVEARASGVLQRVLAARYGVNRATIVAIEQGKTWMHVL